MWTFFRSPTRQPRESSIWRSWPASPSGKKLTEDLVEMSKASSGSIPVNLAPVNVVELVNQALAEYEEKLQRANLPVVLTAPNRRSWSPPMAASSGGLWTISWATASNMPSREPGSMWM